MLSCFGIYWSESDLWSDRIPAEIRFVDSAYESGPLLSLTSACFFCLVKVTSCWPATQWNLGALLVAGTSCSVVSTALIHTLCLVYSGGTVGAPLLFFPSFLPSFSYSLVHSSVFAFHFISHYSHPEFQLHGRPGVHLRVSRVPSLLGKTSSVSLAPTEHLPGDKQSRNPLLVSAGRVFTMRFKQDLGSE